MNLRKVSVIIFIIAVAIFGLAVYYKSRTIKYTATSPTPETSQPINNGGDKTTGPTSMPHVKGPTAPPY